VLYFIQNQIEPLGRPKNVFPAYTLHNPDIGESVGTAGARRLTTAGDDFRPVTEHNHRGGSASHALFGGSDCMREEVYSYSE